jgi:hypothetical protein
MSVLVRVRADSHRRGNRSASPGAPYPHRHVDTSHAIRGSETRSSRVTKSSPIHSLAPKAVGRRMAIVGYRGPPRSSSFPARNLESMFDTLAEIAFTVALVLPGFLVVRLSER